MARNAVTVLNRKLNRINAQIARVLNVTAFQLQRRIKNKHLGGSRTSNIRLADRSGLLKSSIIVETASIRSGDISTTVRIAQPYAKVHFGIKGRQTIIRPRSSRALTIPTKFAKDAHGETLGPAESINFSHTYIANGIIFGKTSEGGKTVPLFILKDEVRVPVRIDIQNNLIKPLIPQLEGRLAKIMSKF